MRENIKELIQLSVVNIFNHCSHKPITLNNMIKSKLASLNRFFATFIYYMYFLKQIISFAKQFLTGNFVMYTCYFKQFYHQTSLLQKDLMRSSFNMAGVVRCCGCISSKLTSNRAKDNLRLAYWFIIV